MAEDTGVASDMIELTTFTSDIDLLSGAVGGAVTPTTPPRLIRVIDVTAGTVLAVVMAASAGVARTLTVAAGEEVPGEIVKIDDATDVTRVRVYW